MEYKTNDLSPLANHRRLGSDKPCEPCMGSESGVVRGTYSVDIADIAAHRAVCVVLNHFSNAQKRWVGGSVECGRARLRADLEGVGGIREIQRRKLRRKWSGRGTLDTEQTGFANCVRLSVPLQPCLLYPGLNTVREASAVVCANKRNRVASGGGGPSLGRRASNRHRCV